MFLVNVLMISMSCLILINFRAKDGSLIRAPLATSHHPQLFAPTRLSKNLVSNEFILASNEFILTVLFRKVIRVFLGTAILRLIWRVLRKRFENNEKTEAWQRVKICLKFSAFALTNNTILIPLINVGRRFLLPT